MLDNCVLPLLQPRESTLTPPLSSVKQVPGLKSEDSVTYLLVICGNHLTRLSFRGPSSKMEIIIIILTMPIPNSCSKEQMLEFCLFLDARFDPKQASIRKPLKKIKRGFCFRKPMAH